MQLNCSLQPEQYINCFCATNRDAKAFAPKEGAEKFTFQAEVNRLMDIIIHSLYSNKVSLQERDNTMHSLSLEHASHEIIMPLHQSTGMYS